MFDKLLCKHIKKTGRRLVDVCFLILAFCLFCVVCLSECMGVGILYEACLHNETFVFTIENTLNYIFIGICVNCVNLAIFATMKTIARIRKIEGCEEIGD